MFKNVLSKNTKIGFKISNVFVGDLKTGNSTGSDAHNQLSEESRKLTYLKLPQLWNQQSFLDYSKYEQDYQFSNGETKIKSSQLQQYQWSGLSYQAQ